MHSVSVLPLHVAHISLQAMQVAIWCSSKCRNSPSGQVHVAVWDVPPVMVSDLLIRGEMHFMQLSIKVGPVQSSQPSEQFKQRVVV
jgi:hypothetical protein